MANLGSNFYPKLVQLASEVGMSPEDILAVMVSESGISPTAHNGQSDASGLIQFIPSTLKGVGFTGSPSDFSRLSGEDQLPYIQRYIENQMKVNGAPFSSAAQYYVSIFWPVALKLPGVKQGDPNTPIVEENPQTIIGKDGKSYSKKYYDIGIKIDPQYEALAYKQNNLFHGQTPGAITYGDMMKQADKNKQSPLYRQALNDLTTKTDYQPTNPKSEVAANTPNQPTNAPSNSDDLDNLIQQFMQTTTASNRQLYKKFLPKQDILIQIEGEDYVSRLEFARILCAALDEELLAISYPHTDGQKNVEIECQINGNPSQCLAAVKQLSKSVAEAFILATNKIGSLKMATYCYPNKTSNYQEISLTAANNGYRQFQIKFIKG